MQLVHADDLLGARAWEGLQQLLCARSGSVPQRARMWMAVIAHQAGARLVTMHWPISDPMHPAGKAVPSHTSSRVACMCAQVAKAYGCRCFIAMPDDAAIEKANILEALGALFKPCGPLQAAGTWGMQCARLLLWWAVQ